MVLLLPEWSLAELLLVVGILLVATYFIRRRLQNVGDSGRKLPPSFPSVPILGSLPFLPTKMEDLAEFCIGPRNKHGKIFSFSAGSRRILVICGRKAIHEALVTKSVDFADRPKFYINEVINPNSKGIASAHYNSAFKQHHQLCLSILKRFGYGQRVMETRILREVEEMVSRLQAEQGRPFDVKQLMTSCVANVVANMLFGRRFDHSNPQFQQLISDINFVISNVAFEAEIFRLLRFLPHYKKMVADVVAALEKACVFVDAQIAECRQDKTISDSFVQYYIEDQGPCYDHEQLNCTIRDLMAAGMETTATTIRWAIVLLTNHVAVQERLHAEVDSVVGRQTLPTLDDRSRMPYMVASILEVMRYKTLLPFTVRATLQDTEVGGYFVPSETMLLLSQHSVHMDPDEWQQPQQFRPERFLDSSGNVIGREHIMPFGLGKRSCLGEQLARQEIFLFLSALLQNFYFRPPEGQESIEVREVWGETNSPSDYEVRMIARST